MQTLSLPHVFVINLKRRPDRLAHFASQAAEAHINSYERWEAVDGYCLELTEELLSLFRYYIVLEKQLGLMLGEAVLHTPAKSFPILKEAFVKRVGTSTLYHYFLIQDDKTIYTSLATFDTQGPSAEVCRCIYRKGMMGCALSHYALWQEIVRRKLPQAVVFEDDASFTGRFEVPLPPKDFDLFYFGGTLYEGEDVKVTPETFRLTSKMRKNMATFAYMISYKGAKKLLKRVAESGFYTPLDVWLKEQFDSVRAYGLFPFTVFPVDYRDSDT